MKDAWIPDDAEVVGRIRDAGESVEISPDLRYRVLDGVRAQCREDRAWQKAFSVCLLVTLLATAVGWWSDRLAATQMATIAQPRWSWDWSRLAPPDEAEADQVLSWFGWTTRRPDHSTPFATALPAPRDEG